MPKRKTIVEERRVPFEPPSFEPLNVASWVAVAVTCRNCRYKVPAGPLRKRLNDAALAAVRMESELRKHRVERVLRVTRIE
jgi:hypothetical protein